MYRGFERSSHLNQRSRRAEVARGHGPGTVPVDPPRLRAAPDADGLAELGADVVQADAVLARVARWEGAVRNEPPVRRTAGLVVEVVVHAVGEGQQPEAVGERVERVAERVRRAAEVPAEAARAHPGEHHARLPALAHHGVQAVSPPDRQQVHDAAALDEQQVLGQQVPAHVGDAGLREEGEHRELDAGEVVGEPLPLRRHRPLRVPEGGREVADARGLAAGQRQRVHQEVRVGELVVPGPQHP